MSMIRRNDRTNRLIMWSVVVGDFLLLNALLLGFVMVSMKVSGWSFEDKRMFLFLCNISLILSELKFHTKIHRRYISAGDIVKGLVNLTVTNTVITYLLMRHLMYWKGSGWLMMTIGTVFFVMLLMARLVERLLLKRMRSLGMNTRTVTFVGDDLELKKVFDQLINDPTAGYRMLGYYADQEMENGRTPWLGTVDDLMDRINQGEEIVLGDDLYVCLSKSRKNDIVRLSRLCDKHVSRFYYVPRAVDSLGLNLHREFINEIEIYGTHESPLENVLNQAVKRVFDIVVSIIALAFVGVLFPFIYLIIKIQSPGPIFFKQLRTGLDGKEFMCYKFRSMHVNSDADRLQATKDDPRKYPFGDLMRKTNIDELPQFWNVLRGDMSIVGPRPHMLAHTAMYSELIDKYMVRHFVKPGITGWAQVTGFRGETKELWQMEGRVTRDIWYLEHWSFWLDLRIVWRTFRTIFVPDKNAY